MVSGAYDLGSAYGRIVISDNVDEAVGRAQRSFDNAISAIGSSMQRFGDGLSNLGGSLTVLTAPLTAFGVTGLKVAADFDTLMNQIQVFGNVAPSDLNKVREAALKFGADTKFSAGDAAEAMLDLLKSGQDLQQTMATMPAVLDLAGAGEISLAQAAGITTAALAMFRLSAEDAGRVSDALAQAASASRADVSDLGQALTNVGPVAANFGLSVEDTAAILATLANNGLEGAEAGTQLKSMLLNMTRPTDDVKGALQRLGVSLYDGAGNVKDFNTFIKELDKSLDALPVEQQNELMQTLGGSYGIVGLSALRAAGGIDDMRAAMEGAPGAAEVAARFMDTFAGRMESLKGSIETLQITALTPLMNEVLGPLVLRITEIVNAVTGWINRNPELASQIVRILAMVVAVGPAMFAAGKAISAVGGIVRSLGTAISLVTSPIGLVIAAIGALVWAFQNNFLGLRDALEPVITLIERIVNAFRSGATIGDVLRGLLYNLFPEDAAGGIIEFFTTIGQALEPIINAFQSFFDALGAGVPIIDAIRVLLFNLFGPVVASQIIGTVGRIGEIISGLWEAVRPVLENLWRWFTQEALPAIVNFITGTVIPAVGEFIRILGEIWGVVGPALLAVWNWFLVEGLPWIVQAVSDFKTLYLDPLIKVLVDIWTAIQPGLQDVYDWFVTTGLPAIGKAISDVVGFLFAPDGKGGLLDILKRAWTEIKDPLETMYNFFKNSIGVISEKFITPLINAIQSLFDKMTQVKEEIKPLMGLFSPTLGGLDLTNLAIQPGAALPPQPGMSLPQQITQGTGMLGFGSLLSGISTGNLMQLATNQPTSSTPFYGAFAGGGVVTGPTLSLLGEKLSAGEFEAVLNSGQISQLMRSGGGDTINLNVPLEVLRNEPHLEENARTFAQKFMEIKRSRGG